MAVHNIDEIAWLSGRRPERVSGFGSLLYNQQITDVEEDFDDAFLQMYFTGGLVGQVAVSRNHVAGYRNETWVYGPEGIVHVGDFSEDPLRVPVEVIGRGGLVTRREFTLRDYGAVAPVFMGRFGLAYKAELAHYIDQCLAGAPFGVNQGEGLTALEVAMAGSRALRKKSEAVEVKLTPM